jgi:hypothetical protein
MDATLAATFAQDLRAIGGARVSAIQAKTGQATKAWLLQQAVRLILESWAGIDAHRDIGCRHHRPMPVRRWAAFLATFGHAPQKWSLCVLLANLAGCDLPDGRVCMHNKRVCSTCCLVNWDAPKNEPTTHSVAKHFVGMAVEVAQKNGRWKLPLGEREAS